MAKFNPEEYENVEDRLKVFWKDNPKGRIETEILHITPDGQCVTIQSSVFKQEIDARPVTTGIAQEIKGQGSFANAASWMENCETSAIGRALANWKYQGSNKKRPSKEEMSKVGNTKPKADQPKKKPIAQEPTKPHSSITESQLKEMVFSMCNEDKNFAKKCFETSLTRLMMDKTISKNVSEWSNDTVDKFLLLVESYVTKFKKDFEQRAGNSEVVNTIIETLGDVKEKESEDDMADIPEGKWMDDPISDGQKNFINSLIEQAIDAGQDELGAEAKKYLASGEATKGNASAMIDKLKSALS